MRNQRAKQLSLAASHAEIVANDYREKLYTGLLRECALKIPRKQHHWRRNVIS